MLELVTADRAPVGDAFHYANTNYLLLGLVIEQVRGQPVADVLLSRARTPQAIRSPAA
jgi:CubicO group peptidase (beta-lactamase class C family)